MQQNACTTKATCTATSAEDRDAVYTDGYWLQDMAGTRTCPAVESFSIAEMPVRVATDLVLTHAGLPQPLAGLLHACMHACMYCCCNSHHFV